MIIVIIGISSEELKSYTNKLIPDKVFVKTDAKYLNYLAPNKIIIYSPLRFLLTNKSHQGFS